jgi:hypothetical protein
MAFFSNDEMYRMVKHQLFYTEVAAIVRQQVSTELFWQQLFKNNEFKREFEKIPGKVRDAIKDEMTSTVKPQVRELTENLVKAQVASEVLKQLPTILGQNVEFRDILRNHQIHLEGVLSAHVNHVLDPIIQDATNRVITDSLLKKLDKRADDVIKEYKGKQQRALTVAQQEWSVQSIAIKREVDQHLDSIKGLQQTNDSLSRRMAAADKHIDDLESSNNFMKFGLGVLLLATGYLGLKLHKVF